MLKKNRSVRCLCVMAMESLQSVRWLLCSHQGNGSYSCHSPPSARIFAAPSSCSTTTAGSLQPAPVASHLMSKVELEIDFDLILCLVALWICSSRGDICDGSLYQSNRKSTRSACQDEVLKYTGKAKANLQSFINVQCWKILEDLQQGRTFF